MDGNAEHKRSVMERTPALATLTLESNFHPQAVKTERMEEKNAGPDGSMDIEKGNGMTLHVDSAHAFSAGKDSEVPSCDGSGYR